MATTFKTSFKKDGKTMREIETTVDFGKDLDDAAKKFGKDVVHALFIDAAEGMGTIGICAGGYTLIRNNQVLLEDSTEEFELVIWDNGSTDRTSDFLTSVRDRRIAGPADLEVFTVASGVRARSLGPNRCGRSSKRSPSCALGARA